jgi:hypothetical protein
MLALVDETAGKLGPIAWREASGASLQDCMVDGRDGMNYTYTRIGPPSSDPARDATLVNDFWVAKGYETELTRSSNPRDTTLRLTAAGEDVKSIRYSVDFGYSGFTVESVCIPGDITEIVESGEY